MANSLNVLMSLDYLQPHYALFQCFRNTIFCVVTFSLSEFPGTIKTPNRKCGFLLKSNIKYYGASRSALDGTNSKLGIPRHAVLDLSLKEIVQRARVREHQISIPSGDLLVFRRDQSKLELCLRRQAVLFIHI
jgi:hypothetical protein